MNKIKKTLKIKVIKKKDISVDKTPRSKKDDSPELTARNMVSTISTWVDEVQKRRIQEAKAAVARVYESQPQNV